MRDIRIAEAHDAQDPRDIAALHLPRRVCDLIEDAVAIVCSIPAVDTRPGEPEPRATRNSVGGAFLTDRECCTDEPDDRPAGTATTSRVGHHPGPRIGPRWGQRPDGCGTSGVTLRGDPTARR
jgi:hypothetical protein